jgi:ADP-ribose pyrophosphatase YjhB (NUDIX family)
MPYRRDYWDDPKAPKPTSRKASASVLVQDDSGSVLLLQRTDNGLWTIPTGAVKKNETVAQAAIRECKEETGLDIELLGLVGVFSDPRHIIAYKKEVRQPINICFRARVIGGKLTTTKEASAVEWVTDADSYEIHPAIRQRISQGLTSREPHW